MKLKQFIQRLKKIEFEHGENLEVVMADDIAVLAPVFLEEYRGKKVVITDQK